MPKLNNARQQAIAGYIYNDIEETELISVETARVLLQNIQERDEVGKYIPYLPAVCNALKQLIA